MALGAYFKIHLKQAFWGGIIITLTGLGFVGWGISQNWGGRKTQKIPCTIGTFEITSHPRQAPTFQAEIEFTYAWEGRDYTGTKLWPHSNGHDVYETLAEIRESLTNIRPGAESVFCFVNPGNPRDAALQKGGAKGWGFIVSGSFFVLLGTLLILGERLRVQRPVIALTTVFFGAAGVFSLFYSFHIMTKYLAAQNWEEVSGEVIWSCVQAKSGSRGNTYRPDIFYQYRFRGQTYQSNNDRLIRSSSSGYENKRRIIEAHPPGSTIACYVNPSNPWQAVLQRDLGWDALWLLFPLPFLAVSFMGFREWKSARPQTEKEQRLSRKERLLEMGRLRERWRK